MNDEIVAEIRNIRRQLESEYKTPNQYLTHLQIEQQTQRSRLVRLEPRLAAKRRIA